jgi:hypothetical protein
MPARRHRKRGGAGPRERQVQPAPHDAPRVALERPVAEAASALCVGHGMDRVAATRLASRWYGRPMPSDHREIVWRVRPRGAGWIGGGLERPTSSPRAVEARERDGEELGT